ncbi:Lar family restriction alleviation protein [Enterococcus faecalis]|uniref:Lar family restriction alleviation protein n=1 Tax=Enterococcus faecalis TaxID=1351 RepID=UPI00404309A1
MSEVYVKPCPFCGSEKISFNAFSISPDAYVLCKQCNASIEISVPWDDMDEKEHDKVCFEKLSVLWNKRASESNQPELNENQRIVLEWLKEEMKKENMFPIICLWELHSWYAPKNVCSAYLALDKDQQFQLLSAFIEWAEQEEG